jgi:carbohydrate-binding DOMON domain-containing protein
MQIQLNKYNSINRYGWMTIIVILMMALGSNSGRAQDSGTSPAATQPATSTSTAPSTSTQPSTTTTTTETPATSEHTYSSESMQGISTNTWILIGIGVIVVLLIGILIARSSRTKETISRTTIIK